MLQLKSTLLNLLLFLSITSVSAQGSGNIIDFNGTSQSINLGNNTINNCRTIEFWFKLNTPIASSNSSIRTILGRDYANGLIGSTNEFCFYIGQVAWAQGGRLIFQRFVNNNVHSIMSDQNSWDADRWYHIAGVLDPVLGMRLYVNGVLQSDTDNSTAPVGTMNSAVTDDAHIGRWGFPNIRHFAGEIDEMRLWTTARSMNEIRSYMCQRLKGNETGLKSYYEFNESSGGVLPDLTSNNNDGTLVNMTNLNWKTSGAPIGDTSVFIYNTLPSKQLSLVNYAGDTVTITSSSSGFHIYAIDTLPNSTTGLPTGSDSSYFGVFQIESGTPYDLQYQFNSGCSGCAEMFSRNDNTGTSWTNVVGTKTGCDYNFLGQSSVGSIYRAEYAVTDLILNVTSFLGNDTALCTGDSIVLNAGPYGNQFEWQDNSTDSTFTVKQTGTYWVEISTPFSSCVYRDSIVVTVEDYPTPDLGQDTAICFGEMIVLNAIHPNSSYLWSDMSMSSALVVGTTGKYYVEVSTNLASCTASDTVTVDVTSLPVVDLGTDTTLCNDDSLLIELRNLGIASLLWQDNSTDSNYTIKSEGLYNLQISIGTCIDTSSLLVTYDTLSKLDLGPNVRICQNSSITVPVFNGWDRYLWFDGDTLPNKVLQEPGSYSLQVFEGVCTSTDTIILSIDSLPKRLDQQLFILCDNKSVEIDAGNKGSTFLWSTGDTTQTIRLRSPGNYEVSIISEEGCEIRDVFALAYCKKELFIPNLITPNDDGKNDTWIIRNIEGFPNNFVQIFNRNGFLLFETNNYQNDWDGTYEGNELPATTYYYVLDLGDEEDFRKGTITVVRQK